MQHIQGIRIYGENYFTLNKSIIERAKRYAKANNQSLSQIIESYLDKVTSQNPDMGDPELGSIRGIIRLSKDFDLRTESRELRINRQS